MTTIYYVRHGQTDMNVAGVWAGRTNAQLTEVGKEQANKTTEELKNIKFDVAFVSPLDRAKDTFNHINKYHNLVPIIENRIIERSFGQAEGKSPAESISKEQMYDWNLNSDFNIGVEKIQDNYNRVKNFLDEILIKYKDKTVLVVAHGAISRMFDMYFNGIPKNGMSLTGSKNAEVKIYTK